MKMDQQAQTQTQARKDKKINKVHKKFPKNPKNQMLQKKKKKKIFNLKMMILLLKIHRIQTKIKINLKHKERIQLIKKIF